MSSGEVCRLPGAHIPDITEALLRNIQPPDYYPLLLIYVGPNDTARCDLERSKGDYGAVGAQGKEFGAQVVFSLVLPVNFRGPGRDRYILEVSAWQ